MPWLGSSIRRHWLIRYMYSRATVAPLLYSNAPILHARGMTTIRSSRSLQLYVSRSFVPTMEEELINSITDEFTKGSCLTRSCKWTVAHYTACITFFGPNRKSAQLEESKAFSKQFMSRHKIPKPSFEIYADVQKAERYISTQQGGLVVKNSGTASG